MSCPTCDHTMQLTHQYQESGYYWCPRCGTLAVKVGTNIAERGVPLLVERCREYYAEAVSKITTRHADVWRRRGIAESINKPEDRP